MRHESNSNFDPETAYARGRKAGREDGFRNTRMEGLWQLANSANFATQQFGQGYRDGLESVAEKLTGVMEDYFEQARRERKGDRR